MLNIFRGHPPNAPGATPPDPPKRKHPISPPEDGRCLINTVLPPELLTYIFELGCTIDPDEEDWYADAEENDDIEAEGAVRDNDSMSSTSSWRTDDSRRGLSKDEIDLQEFPVLVSHVCRHWRELALNTPFLWSVITYEDGSSLEKNKVFLSRTRDVPLGLSIDCSVEDDARDLDEDEALSEIETAREHPTYTDLQKFLQLIAPHCGRWRTLEVMVSHYLLMQLVLETLGTLPAAPILAVLQLYHYDESQALTFEPPQLRQQDFVLFHGNAPNLSVVALWGVHVDWTRSTFLSGITELEMAYHAMDVRPSYRDFLRMLQTSPQLRILSLCHSGPAGGPVEWLESMGGGIEPPSQVGTPRVAPLSLTLPVTNLVLAFLPPDYLLSLLERISVPELTHLTLDFDEDDYTTVMARLSVPGLGGGRKSIFTGLTQLRISGLPCSDSATIAQALSELSSVVDLQLNFRHIDMIWYTLLSRPERVEGTNAPDRVYCPQLRALTLTGLDGSAARELVEEREMRGHPLKKLSMDEEDEVENEDLEWLEAHLESLEFFEGSEDEDDYDEDDMDDDEDEDDEGDGFVDWDGADYDEDDDEDDDDGDDDIGGGGGGGGGGGAGGGLFNWYFTQPTPPANGQHGVEEDDEDDEWTDTDTD